MIEAKMKLKKKWQENFIEIKLVHLRYYMKLQKTLNKNLRDACHAMKKSLKLVRECQIYELRKAKSNK